MTPLHPQPTMAPSSSPPLRERETDGAKVPTEAWRQIRALRFSSTAYFKGENLRFGLLGMDRVKIPYWIRPSLVERKTRNRTPDILSNC